MTDYQPLNSAEEVQRAFAEGKPVEVSFFGDKWDVIRFPDQWTGRLVAGYIADKTQFRAPKDAPTPEAERSQELPRVGAFLEAKAKAMGALIEASAIGGPARERAADEACRYLVSHFHEWMQPPAALSLPAAQDGDDQRESDRERFPDVEFNRWLDDVISDAGHTVYDYIGGHDAIPAAWSGWDACQWLHYAKAQREEFDSPTPNAIRGEDQEWDRRAEIATREALGEGRINPNAMSVDDIFIEPEPVAPLAIRGDKGAEADASHAGALPPLPNASYAGIFTPEQMYAYARETNAALWKAIDEAARKSCESGGFNNIDEVIPWMLDRAAELGAKQMPTGAPHVEVLQSMLDDAVERLSRFSGYGGKYRKIILAENVAALEAAVSALRDFAGWGFAPTQAAAKEESK